MSTIAVSTRMPLLARRSATGHDDARVMRRPTPHSAPQSSLSRTAIDAATSPIAITDSRDRQPPRSNPITAATKSP